VTLGTILRGRISVEHGFVQQGIGQMHEGLGAQMNIAEKQACVAFVAEAYGKAGQPEKGLAVVAEAVARARKTGLRYYEAELHRVRGELLLSQTVSNKEQAEACFEEAMDVSRRQRAKSLELRAIMSLTRLWQSQGKKTEARQSLAEIYNWFTEGFDTADLKAAKTLLEELS
jgi:predicted ATPase